LPCRINYLHSKKIVFLYPFKRLKNIEGNKAGEEGEKQKKEQTNTNVVTPS